MSTPAIRAIFPLSLTLLVLRLRADDAVHAIPTDDLALVATLLDARLDLHLVPHPSRDATSFEVIWRQLHEDLVAWNDPNEIHPHLPGDVREHRMAVLELDLEHRVGEGLGDRALHLDDVLVARLTACHELQTQKAPRPCATGSKNVPKPHDLSKRWSRERTRDGRVLRPCDAGSRRPVRRRQHDRTAGQASEGVLEMGRK